MKPVTRTLFAIMARSRKRGAMARALERIAVLACAALLVVTGSRPWSASVQAQGLEQESGSQVSITPQQLRWQTGDSHSGGLLTIAGPGNFVAQQAFGAGESPVLGNVVNGSPLPDGAYSYQLVLYPDGPPADSDPAANGRDPAAVAARGSGEGQILSGTFAVLGGNFVIPSEEPSSVVTQESEVAPEDQVILDDLIAQGNLCVGMDCANNMNFGLDSMVLRENNLRILFDDTSTGGFPARDWRIIANDNTSGGLSRFSVQDVTANRIPFTIVGSAPDNAIYVNSTGGVGFGTNVPLLNLHTVSGNTPGLRLQQSGARGFTPQIWDIAGNEANFFVRDQTHGSLLPFRIRPGAPTSSLDIAASGNIGIGTNNPQASLHIQRNDGTTRVLIREVSTVSEPRTLLEIQGRGTTRIALKNTPSNTWYLGVNNQRFFMTKEGVAVSRLRLENNGNLRITGSLTENAATTALRSEAVDSGDVLQTLSSVPFVAWESEVAVDESDDEATTTVRHMSPDVAGFHAAYGLGLAEDGISPLDVASVALAAAQELDAVNRQQAAQIAALQAENAELRARIAAIEAALGVEPAEPSDGPEEPESSIYIPFVQP